MCLFTTGGTSSATSTLTVTVTVTLTLTLTLTVTVIINKWHLVASCYMARDVY